MMLSWDKIKNNYNTFFVDLVGVIHNDLEPFTKAIEALNSLKDDKKLIFISNTPTPSEKLLDTLKNFGIKKEFHLFTSGDYTRHLLSSYTEDIYYHWGEEKNSDLLKGIELKQTTDIHQATKVLISTYLEENEDTHQYDNLMNIIKEKNIDVYCINPDKYALYGKTIRKCPGFFAEKLINRGVQVIYWGKPVKKFYEYIESKIGSVSKIETLMIGDTLETDILGAQNFGIDSLLVLSGISNLYKEIENLTLGQLITTIKPTYIASHLGNELYIGV